jgi:hypothetical protein
VIIEQRKNPKIASSFGTNETRTLKLINEEEIAYIPGPGKYEVQPVNIDELLR